MFRLYQDKNSLKRKYSRVLRGGKSEVSGDKIAWWERTNFRTEETDAINSIEYKITNTTEFRPDIVAFEMYGTTELEWLILQYNNIVDITEEFKAGKTIRLPSKQFVASSVVTRPAGGLQI